MKLPLILTAAAIAAVPLLAIAFRLTMYQVAEHEYALALRFSEVQAVRHQPGLYFKLPFTDSVQRIDKRTLRADIPPREVHDRDKERLIIDTVVRYRISDPIQFRRTLRDETTALGRIRDITYSAMRDTIAERDRIEVIGARPKTDADGEPVYNAAGLPEYESLIHTRDAIGADIQSRISHAVREQQYGVTVISADIKRADFPHEVADAIITRLQAERQRVAARHRADGEEEYRKRTAAVDAQARAIIAQANRQARAIKGEGEAEAIRIITAALERDPAFYRFLRTMESYENTITPGSAVILTAGPDSYLKTLLNPPPAAR